MGARTAGGPASGFQTRKGVWQGSCYRKKTQGSVRAGRLIIANALGSFSEQLSFPSKDPDWDFEKGSIIYLSSYDIHGLTINIVTRHN